MNKYDLEHVCTGHPKMSDEVFQQLYYDAWRAFYTPEHVGTLMKRAVAYGADSMLILKVALYFYGCQSLEGVHPLQGGYVRRKYRRDRRPTMAIESPLIFYPRFIWDTISKYARAGALAWSYWKHRKQLESDLAKLGLHRHRADAGGRGRSRRS